MAVTFPKDRTTAGFSLIEMMVVVIMIIVLFSIAAPSWLSFINSRRANTARDQIAQAIRQAQSEAIRSRVCYAVRLDPVATIPTVDIIRDGCNNDTPPAPNRPTQLGEGQFSPGMISLQTDAPGNTIVFDANGNILEDGETVPISVAVTTSTGTKRCVIVETLLGATRNASGGEQGCS